MKARKSKYNVGARADRTWGGRVFDSLSEMRYAKVLVQAEKNGEITDLEYQPKVVMTEAKIVYKADFKYRVVKDNEVLWVDVKGALTATFRLKLRLWKKYGPGKLRLVKQSGAPSKLTGLVKFKDLGTFGPGVKP
jgi:hypothetical protein